MLNNSSDSPNSEKRICPHLGLSEDAETCLAYPSKWNVCHHAQPVSVVGLDHQRITCLLPAHANCPVFQSQEVLPLPEQLKSDHVPFASRKKS